MHLAEEVVTDLNAVSAAVGDVLGGRSLLRSLTPTNLASERARVVADTCHVPEFVFEPPATDVASGLAAVAASVDSSMSVWHERLEVALHADAEMWAAAASGDGDAVSSASQNVYGSPSEAVCDAARTLLESGPLPVAPDDVSVSATEFVDVCGRVFAEAGLAQWTAGTDPLASARVTVNATRKVLSVRADATFTPADVRRLVAHEIATHVVRGVNGAAQPLQIFASGTPGYLGTEEGLAAWHEHLFATPDEFVMGRYALRVLAAEMSLHSGWAEVFAWVSRWLEPAEAFEVVRRVKRGVVDLSQPGSFVKDYVYLDGVVTVSEFLEREPDCYRMLCAAKISVYDVPVSASILVAPTVMPVDVMAAFDEVVEAGAASKERWATVVGGM